MLIELFNQMLLMTFLEGKKMNVDNDKSNKTKGQRYTKRMLAMQEKDLSG